MQKTTFGFCCSVFGSAQRCGQRVYGWKEERFMVKLLNGFGLICGYGVKTINFMYFLNKMLEYLIKSVVSAVFIGYSQFKCNLN